MSRPCCRESICQAFMTLPKISSIKHDIRTVVRPCNTAATTIDLAKTSWLQYFISLILSRFGLNADKVCCSLKTKQKNPKHFVQLFVYLLCM